jgi:hypothetical protein
VASERVRTVEGFGLVWETGVGSLCGMNLNNECLNESADQARRQKHFAHKMRMEQTF